MKRWVSGLGLLCGVLALLSVPFGSMFYATFGDLSGQVQVYGGMVLGSLAGILGIIGIATHRERPKGLTVLGGLGALLGIGVVVLNGVAYSMGWLGPQFY